MVNPQPSCHSCVNVLDRYNYAFGSPIARIQGAGYVQELVARLTRTPISEHRFSTNSTLDDNPITFPLNQSLYVDATHEVVVLYGEYPVYFSCISRASSSYHCPEFNEFRCKWSTARNRDPFKAIIQALPARTFCDKCTVPTYVKGIILSCSIGLTLRYSIGMFISARTTN